MHPGVDSGAASVPGWTPASVPGPLSGLGGARDAWQVSIWRALQRIDAARPWVLDGALALALLGASLATIAAAGSLTADPVHLGLVLLASLPYALRRRAPLPVLLVAGVAVFSLLLLGHGTAVIGTGLFLGAYTVAARTGRGATAIAAAFCGVLLVAVAALPGRMGWPEFATNLALFIGAFALGWGARAHAESTRLLAERAELAERAQEEASRMAVSEERLRIARDLHDVVGHSLGVIALQAGVGARVALSDPEEARSSLLAIAERSRASLQEVRQILGALRNPEDDAAPSPGLDDLDALVGRAADAGVRVSVTRTGEPWPLTESLGLTAYRVLQESLTNVVKHSGADRAEVEVRYEPDRLVLSVADHGRGAPAHAREGTGQVGMRERVAVWGGRFRAGNRAGGGYEVAAELPRPEEAGR